MDGLAVDQLDKVNFELRRLRRQEALTQDLVRNVVQLALDDVAARLDREETRELVAYGEEPVAGRSTAPGREKSSPRASRGPADLSSLYHSGTLASSLRGL